MPALIPPETTLALSPPRLLALLESAGASRALLAKKPLAIAQSLFEDEHAPEVVAQLTLVDRFAHGAGALALAEGARVAGFVIAPDAIAQGDADVAADVVIAAAGKGPRAEAAQRALARAGIRADRFFVPRASYELVASVPPPAGAIAMPIPKDAARALARSVSGWLGEALRALWTAIDPQGRLHVAIVYVRSPASLVTWPAGAARHERGVASIVAADVGRLDPLAHRLLLTPASEPHLAPLARAFGAAVHGDPEHYGLRPSFSFKTLQALGAHGFARLPKPPGVRAWSVVGCQWDSGREERIEARSDDALASLEARTSVDGGYFPRVTFRVVPEAPTSKRGAARTAADPVDLFIQLPHRITVSDPRREALLRAAGKALGLFEPGRIPDDVRTLAPWVHFEWRWREILGDEAFELLVRKKILTRVKTKKGVATLEHRWLGSSVKLTPVPGEGVHYATPLDFSLPAFDVEEVDAHAYRLDEAALARHIGAAMGLRAGVPAVAGALALGALVVKSGRANVYYGAGRPPAGFVAGLRAACKLGVTPVLCVPRGRRMRDEGIVQVELDLHEQFGVAATTSLVTGRIATALKIEEEIDDKWRLAEVDEVLVVDRKKKRVWLLGVELVHLVDGTFKLIERLVMEAGRPVDVRALGEYVSNAAESDVVVRKRRARLVVQIERSFADADVLLPMGLAEEVVAIDRRGAYRLGVGWKVI